MSTRIMKMKRGLRQRATAVMIRDGKVLLVRDRRARRYSLPGGGMKRRELAISAAARELFEELGLEATKVVRLPKCDYGGALNSHQVCLVEADGEPMLRRLEIESFVWWDMVEPISILPHVTVILRKMGAM